MSQNVKVYRTLEFYLSGGATKSLTMTPTTNGVRVGSDDRLEFYDAGLYIYSSADGQLDIVADTTLTLTAPTITVAGDVGLTGDFTIDTEDINLGDADDLEFGDSQDTVMRWSTGDADNHVFVIGLGDTCQQMHITDKGAVATDWARSAGTHPELAIHSNSTPASNYLAIGNHDGTTAHINVVGGTTLSLDIAGTPEVVIAAASTSPATTDSNALGTTALMWSDLFLASAAVINFNDGDVTLTHAAGTVTLNGGVLVHTDTSTGSGRYTMQQSTLTVGSDHTGQSVTALRIYTNMGSSAHSVGNFYGARIEAALKNAGDAVSGLTAGLQLIIDLGTCASGGTVNGLDMVVQNTGTRATTPNTFIALNDHDYAGSCPVSYLFDFGGLNSELSTGAGKIYHNGTLKIRVNTAARYIPLSTAEGTYTTAYPIVASNATTAITIEGTALGLNFTGTYTTGAINVGSSGTNINLNGSTQTRLVEIHGDCTTAFASGSVCLLNVVETLSGNADVTGSGMVLPIFGQVQIEGHSSTTLWSSTSPASAIGGWMGSNNTDGISQTNGHLLAGWLTVGMGEHFIGSSISYVAGLLINSETHASAAMNGNNYSAIRVMKNSGKLDWIQAFDIQDCGSLLRIEDDGVLAKSTAASPLSDIQAQASAGFIRVLVGTSTIKYIALYDAN